MDLRQELESLVRRIHEPFPNGMRLRDGQLHIHVARDRDDPSLRLEDILDFVKDIKDAAQQRWPDVKVEVFLDDR